MRAPKGRQKVKFDGSPSRESRAHSIEQVEEFVCGANVYAALSGLRDFLHMSERRRRDRN